MKRLDRKGEESLRKIVTEAAEGRFPQMSKILSTAGYRRGTYVATFAELAQGLGLTVRTIKSWMTLGAPPRTPAGYDVLAILKWRNEYLAKQINQPQAASADEELKKVKTDRERLKLRREQLEVLDAADVERIWRTAHAAGKSIILGIPDRLLLLLPDNLRADMQPVLRDAADEVLALLSRVADDLERADNAGRGEESPEG